MTQFQIKRGYRRYLFDEDNKLLITPEEGCWYLVLDTTEVFVAINGQLKPLNQADINLDEYDERFESIEARLTRLEAEGSKAELVFAERSQFPTVGEANMLYIALDKNATFVYINNDYICVGNAEDARYDVINGGKA